MRSQSLFIATAVLESTTGVALVAVPNAVVPLLLGAAFDAPGALVVARIAGAALLALGLASWLARRDGELRAGRGLMAAMLLYNVAVAAVLARYGLGSGTTGTALWPVVLLHSILAAWCIKALRQRDPSTTELQRS